MCIRDSSGRVDTPDTVVARVYGREVLLRDMAEHMQELYQRYGKQASPETLRPFIQSQALRDLMNQKLMEELADRHHVVVTDEEVGLLGPALRAGVAAQHGPLACRLGPATAWFSRVRVLQLPAHGLDDLAAVVAGATTPIVPAPDGGGPSFNGHLTLARIKGRLGPQAQDELQGIPFDSTFAVEHVDLVASEASPQGHVYTTLVRAPLGRG